MKTTPMVAQAVHGSVLVSGVEKPVITPVCPCLLDFKMG